MSYPVSFYACKKILKIEKENKNINSRFTRICKTSTVKNIVNRNFTFVTAWKNTKKVSGWLLSYFLLADCRFTSYWLITVLLLIGWLLSYFLLVDYCHWEYSIFLAIKLIEWECVSRLNISGIAHLNKNQITGLELSTYNPCACKPK